MVVVAMEIWLMEVKMGIIVGCVHAGRRYGRSSG